MKTMINKSKQKLEYIKWQDAHSNSGWFTKSGLQEEIDKTMFIVEEVGWVVYEDKNELHLCSRRGCWDASGGGSEYGQYQRIPKTWIGERCVIK